MTKFLKTFVKVGCIGYLGSVLSSFLVIVLLFLSKSYNIGETLAVALGLSFAIPVTEGLIWFVGAVLAVSIWIYRQKQK